MAISPDTRDRLAASISQLIRTGRHISSRAATQRGGDLPSYGWALLAPLERDGDQRCSTLAARAGVDVSVQVARRPDPCDGRASLFRLTPAGAASLVEVRALRGEWALSALADWDEGDARLLGDLLDRLVTDLEPAGTRPPAATRAGVPTPR
jgi:hypothetical protein